MTEDAVPEADAQDQRAPLDPPGRPEPPRIGLETPEADAHEQAMPVPFDEDEAPR